MSGQVRTADAAPATTRQGGRPARTNSALAIHVGRLARAGLGSNWLPPFLRMRAMRALGFDLDPTACVWPDCRFGSAKVRLGAHVFINIGFSHDGADYLTIEQNVRVGQFVRVITATHAVGPPEQRCTIDVIAAPVVVERGCWIGAGTTLLPGVVVRRGCVIGANATVTRSTQPDGLYVGNPARRIKDLPGA